MRERERVYLIRLLLEPGQMISNIYFSPLIFLFVLSFSLLLCCVARKTKFCTACCVNIVDAADEYKNNDNNITEDPNPVILYIYIFIYIYTAIYSTFTSYLRCCALLLWVFATKKIIICGSAL